MPTHTEGGETARRALRILELTACHDTPQGLADIAAAVGLSKSTTYRLLRVLQEESFIRRVESGGYLIGERTVGLVSAALPRLNLFAPPTPLLRELADLTGETVTVHRRSGDYAILVQAVDSTEHSLRRVARIGEAAPLHYGASGRAILASLPAVEIEQYFARGAQADRRDEMIRRLEIITARGWDASASEVNDGIAGLAAPIKGSDSSWTQGSIAVSGPADRWTPDLMHKFLPDLLRVCEQFAPLQ